MTGDTIVDPSGHERATVHALVDFRDARVLEVGCGDGRLTWLYADVARKVVGIDPLDRHVERAVLRTPEDLASKVRFERGDATSYRYRKSAFDVVVFAYSL